ncbi:MAG: 50S ribosomal protein L11 methyltransferase [Gammaproteobacteria bacterium]|nr:50S ribosomal protein L11 methyltransferase [Gammaproteobacteria bacterium]
MPWIQAIVDITAEQSAEIEDLLMAIGAQAVTMRDGANQPIYEPPLGTTPLWDNVNLWALFDAEQPVDVQMQQLAGIYETEYEKPFPNYKLELVEDKDWVREWMDTFKPMPFGERLWICPSWLEPTDPNAVNLKLDPGLAFGTGTHPTTSLCLKWLDSQDVSGKTVVDFGCGSGILGVAAMILGAQHLVGIDIDPQAILASNENSERNDVPADKVEFYLPEDAPNYVADMVLANILAGPLVELKDAILSYLRPGGQLVLSGILASQGQEVADAYAQNCHIDLIKEEDGWVRIDATKFAE